MSTDVVVPALGESITEATVLEWFVTPGQTVTVDQDLVALETDKITVNVPSPVGGVLLEQLAGVDQQVEVGALIARVDTAAQASPKLATAAPVESADAVEAAAVMPSARRLAAESGIDTAKVKGTGRGGRVLKEDVQATLGSAAPAVEAPSPVTVPEVAAAALVLPGDRERVVPMSSLRRRIAERLVEAQQTAAMLTTFNEIDMSAVIALRKQYQPAFVDKYGIKLGFTSFFAKAVIEALKAVPALNAEIRDDNIVYKDYFDIGVAVGGGRGLVVPVIRDADQMSFAQFELRLSELAKSARDNRLTLADLQGGTFTISNGGVYGSLLSTPILNPPQVGILGLHKIEQRPVAVDGAVQVRPMMYVALSYDHRIVDGKEAVGFLVRIKEAVEDPARILLEI